MITTNMTLNTTRDADFWAAEMLENTQYTESEHAKLSDWIWNEKPYIGCTLSEHPIDGMEFNDMLEVAGI